MRGAALVLVLCAFSGCTGGRGPEQTQRHEALVAQRAALDAWRRGRELLDSGHARQARSAFDEALVHQPADPVVLAWRARAEAAAGEPDTAIETLQTVLSKQPGFAEARYNLASYLVRQGRVEVAAPELRRALADGARDPRDVLLDADFQPHLAHPALAFLPQAPLDLEVKGPGGTVFLGSDAIVRLAVTGPSLDGLQVEVPPLVAPVSLSRIEERVETLPGGDERLSLTWTLRVRGPGRADLGPFAVRSGPRESTADAITLVTLAPAEVEPVPPSTVTLLRQSLLAASLDGDGVGAWLRDGSLVVRSLPGQRVSIADGSTPDARGVYMVEREERYILSIWERPPADPTVTIRSGGQVAFTGRPRP